MIAMVVIVPLVHSTAPYILGTIILAVALAVLINRTDDL